MTPSPTYIPPLPPFPTPGALTLLMLRTAANTAVGIRAVAVAILHLPNPAFHPCISP